MLIFVLKNDKIILNKICDAEVEKLKKDRKLYVARYVPYAQKVRSQKIFMLKTSAVTFAVCLVIITATVFAAKNVPKDMYLKILKGGEKAQNTSTEQVDENLYIYPQPDAETRAKADRMREIRLEDYNAHVYTPGQNELDNVYVYDRKKICYLTFDDGPSKVTERILDVLEQYKVKATFFVTGQMASNNPKTLKAIYDAGHSIGNHSFSHDYNVVYDSAESFKNEVLGCKNAIDNALGFEYKNLVFRYPGGYTSLTDENTKSAYTNVLGELGYKYIDWSCLTGDSNVTDPTPEYLMNTLKYGIGNTKTGDIVVLMHDSGAKEITADVLPQVIEYLYESGFQFGVLKNQ